MRSQVASVIFLLVGLLAGISLVSFIGLLGKQGHSLGDNKIYQEARQAELGRVSEALPYTDIGRTISGDDLIEFISYSGDMYDYLIKFKTGGKTALISDTSDLRTEASDKVINNLTGRTNLTEGDLQTYASSALWSSYYLSNDIFGSSVASQFKPVILVNRTGTRDLNNVGGWSQYKDTAKKLPYSILDVIGGDEDFILVYEEV